MSVLGNSQLLMTPEGYQISRSVRLRSSASAYLSRTPASAGNRRTWTWSAWVKRGTLTAAPQELFYAGNSTTTSRGGIAFSDISNEEISVTGMLAGTTTSALVLRTSSVYRDVSAWYHIIVTLDTTQATASNRCKLYVNGSQVTSFGTATYPNLNDELQFNDAILHAMRHPSAAYYFDGYLAEVNFIDGQALTPSSFGETDAITGVWKPKKYAGTYGTNGFYLNFSDNSAATAAAIGKDSSGNGNNWTPNNISVTSGTTYDSMIDTPTPYADGGNGRGNYAVLNPLLASASLSAGNLDFTQTNTKTAATFGVTSGKWYAEAKLNTTANGYVIVGVAKVGDGSSYNMFASGVGYYANDGTKYVDGTNTSYGATYTAGDTIGIALDMDGGTVTFYKNNTSQGSITLPASSQGYFPYAIQAGSGSTSATWSANFGQRPFAYTPPTGYVALNTFNLPASTISNGATVFAATTYTGTGSSNSVTNGGNPLGTTFKPDLVWIKSRSAATNNNLFDSVRGTTNYLISNSTAAEATNANTLTAFGTTGFTLGSDASALGVNVNAATYVAWQWQAGQGTTSSNTSGSITSTVSVNTTAGFSVVTYTGTGANATVGHGLGVAPKMIIVMPRSFVSDKYVYHASIGAANYVSLNLTSASAGTTLWNSTAPTSSVFTVNGNGANQNGSTFVAYLFSEVAGFSKFGSYTGNGSTDGPFIYCGFRPRWVMVKRTDTTGNWYILDTSRNSGNVENLYIQPQSSAAEGTFTFSDYLSNGFKLRDNSADWNASGGTYIYAAFAENPFKNSLAR